VHKEVVLPANPNQQLLSDPLEHLEPLDYLDLKEKLEIQAVQDFLEVLGHKGQLDLMAHLVVLDRLESVA
jgi:hypothetical protein